MPLTGAQIARRFYELFNSRELKEAEKLVDPHAIFHYVPTRQRLIGRAGYRALASAWIQAFPDAHLEIVAIVDEGHAFTVAFSGRGTLTGELNLGDHLVIRPTGRVAELPFRDRIVINDGLIVESRLDFDVEEMKRLLDVGE